MHRATTGVLTTRYSARLLVAVALRELIFTVELLVVVMLLVARERRRYDRIVDAFESAARRLGGCITRQSFTGTVVELAAGVDDTTIIARTARVGVGMTQTLVWADSPGAEGLQILVRMRSRGRGTNDDPAPAAREVVTNDEPRSKLWLGKATTSAMAKAPRHRFRLVHGRVEATRTGAESDPDVLVAAVRALSRFARGSTHPA